MFSGVGGVVEPPTFILAQEAKDAGIVQDCVEGQIAKEVKPQQHEHDLLETPDRQFLARYLLGSRGKKSVQDWRFRH
jgi:hypothetical protein